MNELKHEELPGYGQMLPIFNRVGAVYKMPLSAMLSSTKSPTPVEARSVCCWLAKKLRLRLTTNELAQVLRKHYNAVKRAAPRIEERRGTDPQLKAITDKLLADLQQELGVDA